MLKPIKHTELQGISTSGGPNIDTTGKKPPNLTKHWLVDLMETTKYGTIHQSRHREEEEGSNDKEAP